MKLVRTGEGESPTNPYQPSAFARMDIVDRAKALRNNLLEINDAYLDLLNRANMLSERRPILEGSRNNVVPTNHTVATLSRPKVGAELVNPELAKVRIALAVLRSTDSDEEGEDRLHLSPTNDVFIDVTKKDGTHDFFLVNHSGFWRYERVEDIVDNPDASITGDYFLVKPEVDQAAVTQASFDDLQLALLMFRPDAEDNLQQ